MRSPYQQYQDKLKQQQLEADPLQANIVKQFDGLYTTITKKSLPFFSKKSAKGIYLWGPVGRGKTMIIDLFLNALPKHIIYQRYHYHAFMRMIHQKLKELQGTKNPLQTIAKQLKQNMSLLFLDEFFVMDMANAMILGDLLKALFKENFTLLTTSNCAPDELYKDGMFRERFLPAIEAIKQNMQILTLACDKDYRIHTILEDNHYHAPDNCAAETALANTFHHLTRGTVIKKDNIRCLDRDIKTKAYNDNVIWFDFDAICAIPRSQNDYLKLAEQFDIFFISHLPKFSNESDAGLYFTMLIDVLYDEHKQLFLSAEAPLDAIFPHSGPLALGFERTYSRLIEMQTPEYNA